MSRRGRYRVTLKEHKEDKFTIVFDCDADDADDAYDQAEIVYPEHHYLSATFISPFTKDYTLIEP